MVTRFFLIFLMKKCPRLRTLLVTVPFNLTVKVLLFIGKVFHLSYNAVNIIIWYMIFPMFWMAILDYKLHRILFVPIWLLLCLGLGYVQRKKFNRFCDLLLSSDVIMLFTSDVKLSYFLRPLQYVINKDVFISKIRL